ncbi:MAG: hypothetical protein EP329_22465 [Deltaproteobacteria bacterium]|nr:MAG: hypothetical protein EP329_22465 [Deltaproteobacteria bacterium]
MKAYWFLPDGLTDIAQNVALDRLHEAHLVGADLHARCGALEQLCMRQAEEITRLTVAVDVLTEVLTASGAVPADRLAERFEARWTALHAAKEADTVRCASCGAEVAKGDAYLSEDGEVCAACADL